MFAREDWADATAALETGCGTNLPLMSAASGPALDRVRFAAIRLSGGHLHRLHEAIQLAQLDWRDLLVASGFANDTGAHLVWSPRRLTLDMIDAWLHGEAPIGVDFQVNDPVQVADGLATPELGAVVSLLALEPEPRYLIELGSGAEVEVYQGALKHH